MSGRQRSRVSWFALGMVLASLIAVWGVGAGAVEEGTTWYVAKTGTDGGYPMGTFPSAPLLTISQAITNADSDDIIMVGGGTYTEHLTIAYADLTLMPWDPSVVTIDGGGTGVVVTIQASGVVFKNFTVTNSLGAVKVCAGAGAPTLTGNTFTLNNPQVIDEDGPLDIAGILTANTFDGAVVVNSIPQTIWGTIQAAVDAVVGSGDTINVEAGIYPEQVVVNGKTNLTIQGVGDTTLIEPAYVENTAGITIKDSDGLTIKDLKIYTAGKEQQGIWVKGALYDNDLSVTGLIIQNTTIVAEGAATGIIADASTDAAHSGWLITGNRITAAGGGIGLQDVTNSTISSNEITIVEGTNIYWTSERFNLADLVLEHNTVSGSSGSQVSVMTDFNESGTMVPGEDPLVPTTITGVTFHGNTFSNWGTPGAGRAIRVGDGSGGTATGTITGIVIDGNTFQMTVDRPQVIGGTDAPSATGSANIFNVSGAAKIQKAVDAAFTGDTVNVAAGPYTENVTVNKALTLKGADSATTTVTAADPAISVITVTASSVAISGFTVTGATLETTAGVYLADGVTLCNVHDNTVTGNGDGIWLGSGSHHNTITNNDVSNNLWQGFEVYISSNNTFEGNTANENANYGFKIDSGDNNSFTDNTANENGKHGFYVVTGDGGGATDSAFTDNTANSNTEYGVRINGGSDNTLTGNTFDGNVVSGIRLKEEITNLTLDSNTISGSPTGIDIDSSVTDVTTWIVTDNCITGNTTSGVSNLGTGTLDASHNWWGSATGPGEVGPGSGDKVSANVTFVPWLNGCGGEDLTLPTITVTLPEIVVQGVPELQEFTAVTENSATTWDPVGYSVKVDHADALVVGNVVLEYKNGATWEAVTLAVVGDNLEGTFGPQGFTLGTGTFTYDLRANAGASAPTGTYTVTVSLKLTSGACETIQTGNDTMEVNSAPTISLPVTPLPTFEVGGAYKAFEIHVENSVGGADYDHVLFQIHVSGPVGETLTPDMFRVQYEGGSWHDLALAQDGTDLVGVFGPAEGFPMGPPYDETTNFRAKAQLTAPAGAYALSVALVYLDPTTDWTLATLSEPFSVGAGAADASVSLEAGWNMVSVPFVPADNVPETVFADVITSGQPLVIYEWVSTGSPSPDGPYSGSYAIPTEIDAGRGYWLYLFSAVTINASGPLASGTYTVPLTTAGWHQISTPKWPVAWSAVRFSIDGGATTFTFSEAAFDGAGPGKDWVYLVAYSYNPDTKLYVPADLTDGAMDPWTGYWICTRVPGLTMNIPMEVPYIPGPMSVHSMSVPAGVQPPAPPMVPLSADLLGIEFGNSPNPIRDVHTTTFYVQGRGADLVDAIRVQIFDQGGQLVYEATEEGASLDWHTDNDYGEYLANGVYLYRLYVRVNDAWIVSDVRKLAILR